MTEFKDVTGNINTLGREYKKALGQGQNVFIRAVGKDFQRILNKLKGETKTLLGSAD